MATASVPIEPNEKECSVCHESFTEPKLLLCGHLLCRHCLVSWLKSQQDAHCPLCRCIIVDPKEREGKSLEVIADGFPTDLAMKAVVDADRILNKDHQCCVCDDVAATSMCLECGDMLCKVCKKAHQKMSLTKHHTVEDLSTLTADKLAANRQATCAVHTDKTSEVFCPTHGASICLLCATTDHRQCPDVTKLETKMEEARETLAELAAILTAGERELERGIDQLDQHLEETEKRTQAAIDQIEAMCNRLESAVKACRRRLKELTLSACSDVREAVNDGKTCLVTRRGRLTSHKRVIERVDDMKIRDAICDMTAVMQTRVKDLDCSAILPPGANVVSMATLVIDKKVASRVVKTLSELDQLKVIPAGILQQEVAFYFHKNHGDDIILSNDQKTAEKQGRMSYGGIVICSQPMKINQLYEIQLDKRTDKSRDHMMPVGVMTVSPDDTAVPKRGEAYGWEHAIIIGLNYINAHGRQKRESTLGQTLKDMPEGSRVGLRLDFNRNMILYLNGVACQEIAATSVPQPAYACFDLRGLCQKITSLPVTILK